MSGRCPLPTLPRRLGAMRPRRPASLAVRPLGGERSASRPLLPDWSFSGESRRPAGGPSAGPEWWTLYSNQHFSCRVGLVRSQIRRHRWIYFIGASPWLIWCSIVDSPEVAGKGERDWKMWDGLLMGSKNCGNKRVGRLPSVVVRRRGIKFPGWKVRNVTAADRMWRLLVFQIFVTESSALISPYGFLLIDWNKLWLTYGWDDPTNIKEAVNKLIKLLN